MGSEWPSIRVFDLASKITKGSTPTKKDGGYSADGVNFLKAEAITDGGNIDKKKLTFVTLDIHEKYGRSQLKENDVLFTMAGVLGRSAMVRKEHLPANTNQAIALIRPVREKVFPPYLFYALRRPALIYFVNNSTSQSAQPNINLAQIGDLTIPLPPLPEQKAIAHILGTLDDKIELNRRMNATLEGMAQALFKSWFVDFDPVIDNALAAGNPIPDELAPRAEVRSQALSNQKTGTTQQGSVDDSTLLNRKSLFPAAFQFTKELGWIPEGWDVGEIENSTSTIIDHRGKTPKKLGHDWAESGIPAVSAKNIKDGKLVRKDTIKFTDTALYERWMVEELQKGDVLMTSEAPLGEKLYLAKQVKWVLSQRLFALRANDQISGVYLYHWLNTDIAKADIDGRASGTTVQGIRQSELRKVKVLTPDENSIGAFSDACDALMQKRAINEENTEQLTKLRDTLLPKLISGELRIPEAKQLIEKTLDV
jgi:type I restriction enzyme S subunit